MGAVLHRTVALAALGFALQAPAQGGASPDPIRQRELVHVVRQDCGSCHGMKLTGGLGPPLTPRALADRPFESLVATIVHGRPGTPMPPWATLLTEADARWIARSLMLGFPQEPQ